MAKSVNWLTALTCAAMISACSILPDVGLTSDPAEETAEAEANLPPKIAVNRIENLELGRLFNGFMLSAFAIAPGTGFYQPELRPRYGGRPGPDGLFEYDFVVRPPANASRGADAPITARLVRADIELTPEMLRSSRGVRVWSARDSVEGRF